jgi:flagellar secretion chaperone FliS
MDANLSYREVAVTGASPVRLVVCLYEQAIEDLRQAVLALEKGDIEGRTRKINHAITVLGQLQGSLDMVRGGDVARNLERFYNLVRTGIVDAQFKQSARILEQQISQLVLVYEAWLEVERATASPAHQAEESLEPTPPIVSPEPPAADWSA